MTKMDATSVAQARSHIAVLRGLYGDIGEHVHDAEVCDDLWAQIEHEQAQLAALVQRVDLPA